MYAVGKIPGSFLRREGRAGEKAILTSRCIDRPIRPLFPKDLRNDCSVVATVMSVDPDCSPEITAAIGVSAAIAISDIPWAGPISSVNVGIVDGEIVINPTLEQRAKTDLTLTVASTADLVAMIEAGGNEIDDETMFNAIMAGHEENKKIVKFIQGIVDEVGKPKFEYESSDPDPEIMKEIEDFCIEDVKKALDTDDKLVRDEALLPIYNAVHEKFDERFEGNEGKIEEIMYLVQKHVVRAWLKDEHKRVDGRGIDEIRPLNAEIDLLSRAHGSGLFTRGQTQVLSVTTLGPMSDAQLLDGLDEQTEKRYIHHYNFPPYSVGETKPLRSPGRREIGHGHLAWRALKGQIPADYPYVVRVVSEILESNGSSSMATVCAGTLALMDAGVKIKQPVSGIAMGLIKNPGEDKYAVLSDILGDEDHLGDMDFKVTGTKNGITATQMDIKVDGLSYEILERALNQAKEGRMHILGKILETIQEPREELKPHAPRIETMTIPKEFIGAVIGPGGKIIQGMQEETGATITIEEVDNIGRIEISGTNKKSIDDAMRLIKGIVAVPEVGEVYKGKVRSVMPYGAFVEFLPGKDGLLHISEIDWKRLETVEEAGIKEGDEIEVKLLDIDPKTGKFKLSRKVLLPRPERQERPEKK